MSGASAERENARRTLSSRKLSPLVFGILLIIASICICIFLLIAMVWRLSSARSGADALGFTPPDARVLIHVENDGCHVTRTEVEGRDAIRLLTWVVQDIDGYTVLERLADHEYTYGYFRGGQYRIHLKAWHQGRYWRISNEVVVNCP